MPDLADLLFAIVLAPFLGAVLVATSSLNRPALSAWVAGVVAVAGCGLLALLAPAVLSGEVIASAVPWLPVLGVDFGFRLDGYAFLFVLLIYGIGALVVLYAGYYLAPEDPAPKFFACLLVFMGAMLGVVLADNLVLLVVFWELTSLSSFLLIGYWGHVGAARQGARLALTITGAGGLALLAGVLLIGEMAGSYRLDEILAAGDAIRTHTLYVPALLLVLLGVFTKSAQFPLHFWLPHAMAAPTPVSAYLHSATMVKAGVFLLGRLYPALAGTETWFFVVTGVGLTTLVIGAWLALFQHDLKGLLAYSTVSHLGLITLLFGLNTPLAAVAAVFHILNHATFKASLFMAAGIIDHEAGSRDMRRLNGLWRGMPITATLAMVSCAGMAGVPLVNGFLSKEMFFAETLFVEGHRLMELLVPLLATVAGVCSVAYSLRFIHDVFFNGEPVGLPRVPHEPPRWMRVPVEILVVLCLAVGMLPAITVGSLLAVAATPVVGGALPAYSLEIWHGFNVPFLMSLIALGGGVLLYFGLQRFVNLHTVIHPPRSAKALYDAALRKFDRAARALTSRLMAGHRPVEIAWILAAAVVMLVVPLAGIDVATGSRTTTPADPAVIVVWALGMLGAVGTVWFRTDRLTALMLLGVTGLVVSLAFAYLSAPDLALTQLLVEVITIILMMLALNYLPQRGSTERWDFRTLVQSVLAVAAGVTTAALAWAVMTRPTRSVSEFFVANSVPQGGGTNVVNVIIVDFRGFDTLGEITVLGIAGLLVYALLSGTRTLPQPGSAADGPRGSLLLSALARLWLPLTVMVAVFLLLRGHNLPGGGFIAGLVLAVAFIVQYVAAGQIEFEARWRPDYHRWIAGGLLLAAITGFGSFALGHPFLTSSYWKPELPVFGQIPITSAMFFDFGVFLTVVGATLLALSEIGRLRARPEAQP